MADSTAIDERLAEIREHTAALERAASAGEIPAADRRRVRRQLLNLAGRLEAVAEDLGASPDNPIEYL